MADEQGLLEEVPDSNSVQNGHPSNKSKAEVLPSFLLVQSALIGAQIIFGGGAVIGKLGTSDTNPIFFALIREGAAGPILIAIALWQLKKNGGNTGWSHRFILTGLALYGNQLFYIIGLKLSTSTTASIWQPSQPIITATVCMLLRYEAFSVLKVIGIVLAFIGAAIMVVLGPGGLSANAGGNVLFFLNCTSVSFYFIWTKPLLKGKTFEPIWITAVSYIVASFCMMITAFVVNFNSTLLDLICSDCNGDAWEVPVLAIVALTYWILLNSVAAYFLLTWGNKYADASITAAYTALQPLTAAIVSSIAIACGVSGLDEPGLNDLGALGIVAGLGVVLYDQRRLAKLKEQEEEENLQRDDSEAVLPDEVTIPNSTSSPMVSESNLKIGDVSGTSPFVSSWKSVNTQQHKRN